MEDRFTYGLNPEKLGAVSSYLCDPNTAPAEFLLVKSQYHAETGRAVSRGALFFQIRQAFLPGEVTAEEANRIGYETAMRWTKGKYQFFVCTHTDKAHIHNHIYFNATAFDRSRKFHNFIGSSFALRRLSDRVCIEHELSVIWNLSRLIWFAPKYLRLFTETYLQIRYQKYLDTFCYPYRSLNLTRLRKKFNFFIRFYYYSDSNIKVKFCEEPPSPQPCPFFLQKQVNGYFSS